jgi:DNA-binding NarL/FixJ family response regulator
MMNGAWWFGEGVDDMEQTRVLVVDDHPVFREGLRLLLADEPDITVVGAAASGADAIASARELQPDIIVMDLHMPDVDGVEATRRIVRESPHIAVLMLTMFDDDESVFAAMRAGARGYLLKGSNHTDIIRAIGAVASGTAVFGPSIAQRVINYFASGPPAGAPVFPELTDREREILALIADGAGNPAIATKLFLSPKTVRNHVSNIFSKLQVADRAEAMIRARRAGLGQE